MFFGRWLGLFESDQTVKYLERILSIFDSPILKNTGSSILVRHPTGSFVLRFRASVNDIRRPTGSF